MINLSILKEMRHSPIRNYVVPGVTSWLIGHPHKNGCTRMFTCDRDHFEPVIPHSHRFNMLSVVLKGEVMNLTWNIESSEDLYAKVTQKYWGNPGEYSFEGSDTNRWVPKSAHYAAWESYYIPHKQIHSIFFSKNSEVLVFEDPELSETSSILLPVVDDEIVNTFKIESWMFKKGD